MFVAHNGLTSLAKIKDAVIAVAAVVVVEDVVWTTRGQFHQRPMSSFFTHRSQKPKKIQLSSQYLFTLLRSAYVIAVCAYNIDEIDPRSKSVDLTFIFYFADCHQILHDLSNNVD